MNLRSLEDEDKQDASSPTKRRHAKTKRNEAAEDAAEMLAAIYDYMRGDNTTYEMETFLRILAEMSVEDKTARGACRDDDDPIECENNKPHGDTFRYHPNRLHPTDVVRMHDGVIKLVSEKIKKFVEFDRPMKIGVDGTEIPIPGDPEKTEPVLKDIGEMFRELPDDATGQFGGHRGRVS
jgi:hypothetical protein